MGIFKRNKSLSGAELFQMMHNDWDVGSPTRKDTMQKVLNLSENVNEPLAYLARAYALIFLGAVNRPDAIKCFESYVNSAALNEPYLHDACLELGKACEAEYDFNKAEKYYLLMEKAWENHPNFKYFGKQPNVFLGRLYLKMSTQKSLDYWKSIKSEPEYLNNSEFKNSVDSEFQSVLQKHEKGYVYKPRKKK